MFGFLGFALGFQHIAEARRKREEGSSATDSLSEDVTDVTDVMDVSPMQDGRGKKEEGFRNEK
ncbi:hypothetical protein [Microcoleus vaginatus]|uniref:hypothetical protein n=1 Tax=Microcoleus vaginatus TaxID=119532 RepID=UPI0032A9A072